MQPRPPVHFDIQFTPRTKKLLIGLLILYIVEIIAGQIFLPLSDLSWNIKGFKIWQPITSFFILDTPPFSPIRFLLSMLGIVFFMPPAEQTYKKRGLLRIFTLSAGLSIAFGALCMVTGIVNTGVVYGLEAFIGALLAVFCFTRPNATILLFFILPIKAEWIGWFSGLISFLFLIAGRDLGSAIHLAGWTAGLVFLAMKRKGPLKEVYKKTLGRRRAAKKPFDFKVFEGGKSDDKDFWN